MSGERVAKLAKLAKKSVSLLFGQAARQFFSHAISNDDPQVRAALIGCGCLMVFGQAWLEGDDRSCQRDREELEALLREYGSLGDAMEKIAEGGVQHARITRELAQEICRLRDLSEEQWAEAIEQAESTHGLIAYVANWTAERLDEIGDQFERQLDALSTALEDHDRRNQEAHDITHAELAEVKALVREALANKTPDEDPTAKQYPPEVIAAAKEALRRGESMDKARAALIQGDFASFDEHFGDAEQEAVQRTFELLTLKGDRYYAEGKFDEAVDPYEKALALAPGDTTALHNLAVTLAQTRRFPRHMAIPRTIELLDAALTRTETGTPRWGALQNDLGSAWRSVPGGDRSVNLQKAITCYRYALTIFTEETFPHHHQLVTRNLRGAEDDLRNLSVG